MADYIVNSNDMIDIANAIRSKTGETNLLTFPDGFINNIENIQNYIDDGFIDVVINDTNHFIGTMRNNSLINFSTTTVSDRVRFQLKKPVHIVKGDTIKMTFSGKTGTTGYSQVYMVTTPYGEIALNNNFNTFNTTGISLTENTYPSYDIIGFHIGPRHTTTWENVNMTLHLYKNNILLF